MDEFLDNLTAYFDSEQEWPVIGYEIDRVWAGRAEPDVGIMDRYVDDYTFTAWVGDREFRNNSRAFGEAICQALGDDTDLEKVIKLIDQTLDEEAEYFLD